MTIAEALRPYIAKRHLAIFYDLALVIGGSIFVALAARIAIPLPFTPVPITGQTLAVLLVGAVLGSKRGALSMLLYLLEGAAGLPVFAGGTGSLHRLLGPTGGYLFGFVAAAFVTGWLAERQWDRRFWSNFLAMLIGNIVIYLFGLPWLARFVGVERVLPLGLYPFIPGDLVKLVIATLSLPSVWKLIGGDRSFA
ncbi:MAG: biotin transporter BioY [Anaerolineae bacterium]|nr:biotin transporter BioY [Anaerolineae bacterium]MDW8101280.1 biotin transporter BioY [Anaerolineae bacterium]